MNKPIALFVMIALFVSVGLGCKESAPAGEESSPITTKPVARKAAPEQAAPDVPPETETANEPEKAPEPIPAPTVDLPKTPELPIDEAKLDVVVGHMSSVVGILEANAADPGKAAAALDEYLQKNKQAITDWRAEMEALKDKLTPEQQQVLGVKLLGRLGPVMQKLQGLNEAHPELFSDPKVKEVWGQLQ